MTRLIAGYLGVLFGGLLIASIPNWREALPPAWRYRFVGVEAWQYVGIGLLFAHALLAALVGRSTARRVLELRDRLAPNTVAEGTRRNVLRSAELVAAVLAARPLVAPLRLPPAFDQVLDKGLAAGSLAAILFLVLASWDVLCDTLAARSPHNDRAERLLVPVTRKFGRFAIVVAGLLIGLANLTPLNVPGFLASLGIGGIVVALAAKDSVENVFGSVTILFDMPFALGDWVKIGTVEGVVEEINLRSTRIRTFEDTIITLPNANLIRASVENYGARRSRRQRISLRISYDTPPDRLEAYVADLREFLEAQPEVPKERSIVAVDDSGEFSLGVFVQTYFEVGTQAEELAIKERVLLEALRLRDVHGVMFAAHPRPLPPTPPESSTVVVGEATLNDPATIEGVKTPEGRR